MGWTMKVDHDRCTGDAECVDVWPVEVYALRNNKAEPADMEECLGCDPWFEVCEQESIG